ncbi:MAG: class I tRNA ligase family protein [Verrucomicrobiota bacterium]
MSKPFYITTAIDYVNGQPHLGHAYEKVITDVIARARRSLGQEVFFLTGLDEHGQKVQQAAQAKGISAQAYCDQLASDWQAFTQKLELTNNDFVRTTALGIKSLFSPSSQDFTLPENSIRRLTKVVPRRRKLSSPKDRRPGGTPRSGLRRSDQTFGSDVVQAQATSAVVD